MLNPVDSGYSWQALLAQHQSLADFKDWLPDSVQSWLDACEWTLTSQGGHRGACRFLVLRCPGRVHLRNSRLIELATLAQIYWGPLDFSSVFWRDDRPGSGSEPDLSGLWSTTDLASPRFDI
jgi:hypothetical protein